VDYPESAGNCSFRQDGVTAQIGSYSPEVRERAVRMVLEHQDECASQRAASLSIAGKLGCSSEEGFRRVLSNRDVATLAEHLQGERDTRNLIALRCTLKNWLVDCEPPEEADGDERVFADIDVHTANAVTVGFRS